MSVWSHRPRLLHLALLIAAYVLGCAFAKALRLAPGTNISIWLPGGLLMATLILAAPRSWPWWILAGCIGELLGQLLFFHSPLPAALLIYGGNALEAAAGAWLVNRFCGRPVRLENLQEVLLFVLLAAGVAPILSATVGSATLEWFSVKGQTFTSAWPLWWVGDATGVLIVTPLALVVFQSWRRDAELLAARWIEACVIGMIFLGVAALSLSGYLPFAYIIMPPLLWAAVRFDFKGAAVTLTLLGLITAVFTVSDADRFTGDAESQREKQIMLHLFLAISAFSALIVAVISRQHQRALETLRQSERSLRELVETLPAHIWCVAPDGKLIYFSQQFRDFVGVDVKDAEGTSRLWGFLNAIVHPDDRIAVSTVFGRSIAAGEPCNLKHRLRRFDGEFRWIETLAAPMRNSDGAITQWNVICLDIDGEVRTEEELRRARERVTRASQAASLAELSASIAHEVNQPLAAIVANSHACDRWLSAEPANLERAKITVARIIRDANAAADVVSRIRALFKPSKQSRNLTAFDGVVAEVLDLMAEESARRRVRVEAHVDSDLPPVAIDRVQIQQVLINLMRNGIEAMDATPDVKVLGLRVRRVADAIQIEVSDRGPGVEFPDKIFEPFFTTKGHGMGMGLAICRSIVEAHAGRLWEERNEPRGAKFIFALPLEAKAAAA